MRNKNTLRYDLSLKGSLVLQEMKNERTAKSYARSNTIFADFCKEHGVKRLEQIEKIFGNTENAIQEWVYQLVKDGKSPATIHTWVAGICKTLNIPMEKIDKPKRKSATIKRSRTLDIVQNAQGKKQQEDAKYERLVEFQKRVGIRRAELKALKSNDFVQDESGKWCVVVRKGKGGKFQLQRVLPDDVYFVQGFFCGSADVKVFSDDEMHNKIDLHHLRALHAQEAYAYYLAFDQQQRAELWMELVKRFLIYHQGQNNDYDLLKFGNLVFPPSGSTEYVLRGDNARKAREHGIPLKYDRLSLMAVSVFHLSHWRLDVTVNNYMLTK